MHISVNAECKGESQEHIQSKIAIKEYLPKIKFKYCKGWQCPENSKSIKCKTQPYQFNNNETSVIEYSLKCTGTYKYLDVGVLDNENPICAIEVIKTSPTTEDKKNILQEKKIQLIEVNCDDVLEATYKTKDIEKIIFGELENTDNEIIIETCDINHNNCNQCKKLYEERAKEVRELWRMREMRREKEECRRWMLREKKFRAIERARDKWIKKREENEARRAEAARKDFLKKKEL